jgi:CRP-like cAMP-binding protein
MPGATNQLLELLARKDRALLLALCEPMELDLGQVLCEPDRPLPQVYFPTGSFISLVAQIDGKPCLEVGLVGSEGMLGAQLALGIATAPLHALVQGGGPALRVASPRFRRHLSGSPALQRCLHRYLYVLMQQLATSAPCLRFHQIAPRLARWLLMSQDRAHSSSFHITHEFLAYMLGVRRAGVTVAASALHDQGLIEYHRGELKVLDRKGLESAACSCYATDRRAYARLLDAPARAA